MSYREVEIKELGKVITGTTPPTKHKEYFEGNYPFIKPSDLQNDSRHVEYTEMTLSQEGKSLIHKNLLPLKTTCIVTIGTIGKYCLTNKESFTNQQINAIIPNEKFDNDYVFYLLKSNIHIVKAADAGSSSGRENVNKSSFQGIKIWVHENIQTQKRIADILSAYDDLIENNLKRIKLLEQAAQNIYKEWFIHLRFPGHENTPINEDTGLPVGWEEKALGEFTEIKKGKNITKSTILEGNVPVVAGGLKPAYYHNVPNTINPVITVSASGANAGYVNIYLEDIWASDCSYIDTNLSDSIFFIHNLLSHQQDLIFGMQRGAAQPHVYPKDLKRTEFLIPEKDLIIKFEEQVSPQYKMKRVLLGQNQKLKAARDILLPRLMNRTIEVE
jgi:type I restriction enzyme S subunit